MPARHGTGAAYAVASVLLFSGFTLASRLGLASSLAPPDLAALRFGIGGLLMVPVLRVYGWRGVRRRDAAALALSGGLGFALLAYSGFALAPAAHGAALLHGTLPLFTFAIARFAITSNVMVGWGIGVLVRLVTLVVYGFLILKPYGLPPISAMISLVAFFFLSTLIEPVLLKS